MSPVDVENTGMVGLSKGVGALDEATFSWMLSWFSSSSSTVSHLKPQLKGSILRVDTI